MKRALRFAIVSGALLMVIGSGGCVASNTSRDTIKLPPPPLMRTETLGTSVENRLILLHRFGDGPVGTLVIGGFHGDEPTGIYLAERLVELLQRHDVQGRGGAVAVIPIANPDGALRGTRRNSRGVDINRNFPAKNWTSTRPSTTSPSTSTSRANPTAAAVRRARFNGGPAPLSEPEAVVLKAAVETLQPKRIVSIHSITRGRECNNYDGPALDLAERMARHNGYPVKASIGYPTPGSFGSWAGIDLQIPLITLELPRDLPGPQAWETNREALLEALREPGE